jgi:hypothetical protein
VLPPFRWPRERIFASVRHRLTQDSREGSNAGGLGPAFGEGGVVRELLRQVQTKFDSPLSPIVLPSRSENPREALGQ